MASKNTGKLVPLTLVLSISTDTSLIAYVEAENSDFALAVVRDAIDAGQAFEAFEDPKGDSPLIINSAHVVVAAKGIK